MNGNYSFSYKFIILFTIIYMFVLLLVFIYLRRINERKFIVICKMYKEKFNTLPLSASVLYDASPLWFPIGNSIKMGFIIWPLIFGRKTITSKNENDVSFILGLDKKLTFTFKVDFYLSCFSLITISLLGLIIYYLPA